MPFSFKVSIYNMFDVLDEYLVLELSRAVI